MAKSHDVHDRLTRLSKTVSTHFGLFSTAGTIILLLIILTTLGHRLAIKAGYLLVAAGVFNFFRWKKTRITHGLSEATFFKLNLSFVLGYVSYSTVADPNLTSLVLTLIVVSSVFSLYLIRDPSRRGLIFQGVTITVLVFSHVFLTAGIYVGNVDPLWQHYPNVKQLLEGGFITSLSERYQNYPNLFIITAALGNVSGLSSYPASILYLLVMGVAFSPITYLFIREYADDSIGMFSSALGPTIPVLFSHLLIFFPQTMAVVLGILFVHVALRSESSKMFYLALLVGISIILTHHLTVILFLVIVIPLLYLTDRSVTRSFLSLGVATLLYWVFVGKSIIMGLAFSFPRALSMLYQILGIGGGTTQTSAPSVIQYGVTEVQRSLLKSALYLVSFQGLYFTGLGILSLASFYYAVTNVRRAKLVLLTLSAGVFIFPLPISFLGKPRISFIASVVFLIAISLGLKSISTDQYSEILPIVLIMLIMVFGPLVGVGYNPVNEAPNEHEFQKTIPRDTTDKLQKAADFSNFADREVTSFRVTSYYVSYMNGDANNDIRMNGDDLYAPSGVFLYRQDWEEYRTSIYRPFNSTTVLFSSQHIRNNNLISNKVYTAGDVGILWSRQNQSI